MMLRRRDALRLGLAALGTAAAPAPAFPLRPASDRRTLVDARGTPFFIQGDSPQAIYARLSSADLDLYLATRQAQGFNTLLADPTFTNNNDGHVRPAANGHLPFLRNMHGGAYDGTSGTADFATPNPAYWNHVDAVLARAEARGFLVLQYVLAWGFGGKSMWLDLINARNTAAVCEEFGTFLGRRFRGRANVVWIDGSDFDGDDLARVPDGTSGIARALAVARGMQAAGARQMRTGDWQADSLSTDQPAFAPLMSLNGVYTYGDKTGCQATYVQAGRAWQHTPTLPAFLKETGYEAEHMIPGDPAAVRKYEWWALLSGAASGVVYGNGDIWRFAPGWRAALHAPGGQDMQRMGTLMRRLAWPALVPSERGGMRRLVTSPSGRAAPRPDHAAAAQTPDGLLLVAYVPPYGAGPQRLALDLGAMHGGLRAAWWDPTSAAFHPAAPEEVLTTPGRNAGGANDWVLVVQGGD